MRLFVGGPYAAPVMAARLRAEHALIGPYVVGPEGEKPGYTLLGTPAEFTAAIDDLIAHAQGRYDAATLLLRTQPP
jgi:hypothetical protein